MLAAEEKADRAAELLAAEAVVKAEASVPMDVDAEGKESWVQCDSCNKWRRIPTTLAEQLSDSVPW